MHRISFRQARSRIIVCATLCLLATLISPHLIGSGHSQQTPVGSPVDQITLHQALIDLTNPWTVMCVAAHPDDEDGTTLTILRRKYGVHTVSVFSTYGEGGQNAVGPELYEELGVIRARETRAAAEIQGSEPHFLGLKDFGYSKSTEEAFRVWGHEEALRRLVQKFRELQPDVVITNHDTARGHGHHQATGRLVLEAFEAAADPKRFPEQLTKLRTWQAQRLFVRMLSRRSTTGQETEAAERVVTIDPNELDKVRGNTFAEQALSALQQHASQGPWPRNIQEWLRLQNNRTGRLNPIRYKLAREAQGVPALPDGASTFLEGLKLPQSILARTAPPVTDGQLLTKHLDDSTLVLKALIAWRRAQSTLSTTSDDSARLRLLNTRADRAFAVAAGVSLTLTAREDILVPGDNTSFSINVTNAGPQTIQLNKMTLDSWGVTVPLETAEQLLPETETNLSIAGRTPTTAHVTVPKPAHLYDGLLEGQKFSTHADLDVEGVNFSITADTQLDVAPAVEVLRLTPSPYVLTPATIGKNLHFSLSLRNNLTIPFNGTLQLGSKQLRIKELKQAISLKPNSVQEMKFTEPILATGVRRPARSVKIPISIEQADTQSIVTRLEVPVVYSDARVAPSRRIGYLASFDDTLQSSLAALGVTARTLNIPDLEQSRLAKLDVIIIDNRGYEAHAQLKTVNSILLRFVEQGGTLIVFYHKDNEWNPDVNKGRSQLAPYPIVLGEERVTNEDAPVRFLAANHPLLWSPNHIGAADFEDWIQERGLYYPKVWDRHYVPLLSSNDPGEPPLDGGLLVARYGRGNYIYTSMVWYRQLRAGVPGAYRMLANMISYGNRWGRTRR
ncbi:MAG TPA: PIG-L family deacetylase [Pyrinomonadaceae bacterium]|nr:PIG-L family deacetylase [Pyrinomonadaceae bacterium]